MDTIVIREYDQRFMVEEAKGLLDDAGIPSMLAADDGGGAYPQLGFSGGYRLLVRREDQEEAEKALEVLGPYTPVKHRGLFG